MYSNAASIFILLQMFPNFLTLCENKVEALEMTKKVSIRLKGVARRVLGCMWPPLCKPFCKQTTYNIQVTIWWVPSVWLSVTLPPPPFEKSWLRPCAYFPSWWKSLYKFHLRFTHDEWSKMYFTLMSLKGITFSGRGRDFYTKYHGRVAFWKL